MTDLLHDPWFWVGVYLGGSLGFTTHIRCLTQINKVGENHPALMRCICIMVGLTWPITLTVKAVRDAWRAW